VKKAILLVDNCSKNGVIYRTVLESVGYKVYLASDLQQALYALKDDALSLVISICFLETEKLKKLLSDKKPEIPVWVMNKDETTSPLSSKELLDQVRALID